MIYTTISLTEIERLETVFAYLTSEGWIIPRWLMILKRVVLQRMTIEAERAARKAGERPIPGPWADYFPGLTLLR